MEEHLVKEDKQVDLRIKKNLLEKIVSGEKVEDYRAVSRYNLGLLANFESKTGNKVQYMPREDITHIRFVSGYGDNIKFAICEISGIFSVRYVKVIPEGIKPGTIMLTIKIRQVVKHNL